MSIFSTDLPQQSTSSQQKINIIQHSRIYQFSAVCSQLAQNVQDVAKRSCIQSSLRSSVLASSDNRALNLVLFGVPEDRVDTVWRKTVDDALRFVHGTEVDVTDLCRVVRFVQGKTRPVVVKLRSSWDKRIILMNCRKLKDFAIRIFITADESIQVRRDKALEHWRSRAEKDGKSVEVRDCVMSVDGIQVFSLSDGNLVV